MRDFNNTCLRPLVVESDFESTKIGQPLIRVEPLTQLAHGGLDLVAVEKLGRVEQRGVGHGVQVVVVVVALGHQGHAKDKKHGQ